MRTRAIKGRADETEDEQTRLSASLVRGLDVLRAFRPGDSSLGNRDIMARTGLSKSTVSRITYTLSTLGYLCYDHTLGRYSVGPATISLGYAALTCSAVVHAARPLMQTMADQTGIAVALGTRENLSMVHLAGCRSEGPVTLRLNLGSHLPIWNTAMGLAYMAGLLERDRTILVARLKAADPVCATAAIAAVDKAVRQYETLGYITSFGNWHSYIRAVGIPFCPTDGSPVVAIACSGIAEVVTPDKAHAELGPSLIDLTKSLKSRLEGAAFEPAFA